MVSRSALELIFCIECVQNQAVTTEINCISQLGVTKGLDFPMIVIVVPLQGEYSHQQTPNNDTIYLTTVPKAKLFIATKSIQTPENSVITLMINFLKLMVRLSFDFYI